MRIPTILSPVASFRAAVEVISAGADELYCAVRIPGAVHLLNRAEHCCIPTYDELGRITAYARSKSVDTVLTLELPFVSEFMGKQMKQHTSSCVNEGIDALIVGDIGLIRMVQNMGLDVPIYASTLLGAMNYEAVDFIGKLGVKRVILERHVSIEEISEIVLRNKDLEIEAFVHGSGCSNINANCYLEFARAPMPVIEKLAGELEGIATAPCCWPFDIYEFGEDEGKMARAPILDAFTFCSLCQLPELIETGLSSIKIVGRCMPLVYQVAATKMYRDLVDLIERGQRRGFSRAQRRRFYRMVESFQEEPFQPQSERGPDELSASSSSHNDVVCTERRCYYSSFFHAPYKQSDS